MVELQLTKIQLEKLDYIESRARKNIGNDAYIPHLDRLAENKACGIVRKCLDKITCKNFQECFELNEHERSTRNNGIMVTCEKVKLTFARQAFRFPAAKIYNELPIQIRSKKDSKILRDMLDSNFYVE